MHLEKFQVDKIENGCPSAIITKTAQDSYTITLKQIVRFQERMHLEKF